MAKKSIPIFWLRVRWATVGAVCGSFLLCRFGSPALALPLGILALLLFRRSDWSNHRGWCLLGGGLSFLWMGIYSVLFLLPIAGLYGQTVSMSAAVSAVPQDTSSYVEIEYRPRLGFPVTGQIYLPNHEELHLGDTLTFTADISEPIQQDSRTPHYSRSVGVFFTARNAKNVKTSRCDVIPLRFWGESVMERVKAQLKSLFPEEQLPFLTALLTGDTDGLSDAELFRLNRLGLRHILAVSGLHVGFLVLLLMKFPLPRRVKQLLCVPVLLLFCLMLGGKPSVTRAVVMTVTLLTAPFLERDFDPWSAMRTAFFLLFLCNPFCIENVGLQLSFSSAAGILLFSQRFYRFFMELPPRFKAKPLHRFKQAVCLSLALSFGALSLSLPLSAYYFGTVSLIAPLTNLLILWAAELGFSFGVLALLVSFFLPSVGLLLALPARIAVGYVLGMIELLSEASYFAMITADIPLYLLFFLLVYGSAVYHLLHPTRTGKPLRHLLLLAVSFLLMLPLHRTFLLSSDLAIQVLQVGQGQCILCLSGADAMAIDCGGYHAGERLLSYMENVGEHRLNTLILTHLDSDHTDGLSLLMENAQVDTIFLPPCSAEERQFFTTLTEGTETVLQVMEKDTAVSFGSSTVQCFAPVGEDTESDNNMGLSCLIQRGAYGVLVTGDMDIKTEQLLLSTHSLHADALVVGHHGSKTSTGESLLQAVQPNKAVISVGRNSYGHPSPETLARLEAIGCSVYRTDRNGTVTLKAP